MNKINFVGFMTLAASTLVIVTACSSDDAKATASSGGTASIAQAQCAQESKCDPTSFSLRYASVDDCAAVKEKSAAPTFALAGVTVTNGQLSACADAISASGCNESGAESSACDFTGSLAEGASCFTSIQCASGYCKGSGESSSTTVDADGGSTSSTTTSCGMCSARVDIGAACEDDEGCKAGLGCDETKHTCATLPAKGAACDTSSVRCAADLSCIKSVCADPVAAGGACSESEDDCATGLACLDGKCSNGSDQFTTATLGQPCGVDITTEKFTVCKQSSCVGMQGSQKCVANATAGQPCDGESSEGGGTLPGCANGLECTKGTCVAPTLPTCN